MYYICLDTNAWIYLANGREPVKLLHYIESQVIKGTIKLIVPELVIEEWDRNKDNIKTEILADLKNATDNFKRITKAITKRTSDAFEFLFNGESKSIDEEYFTKINDDIKANKEKLETAINQNISLIEMLFNHPNTIKLKTTDLCIKQAADLALQKKAPFLKKNSFADAVILLSFCNYIEENKIASGIFISYNHEDYCKKENNRRFLHPDLQPFITKASAKFFTVIGEAINTIEKVLTEEELLRIHEVQEEWEVHYCEVCEDNRRYSELFFSDPFDIDNENIISYPAGNDPELPLPRLENQRSKPISQITTIQLSQCSYCGTEHYMCQKCGSVHALWDHMYNERTECEGCGTPYYFDRSYSHRGDDELQIRVLKDLKTCQGCNNDFEELSDSGLCQACEEHYGTET